MVFPLSPITSRFSTVFTSLSAMEVISETAFRGTAYTLPLTETTSARTMASVSGRVMVKLAPLPRSLCVSMSPERRLMFVLTTSRPTPRPRTDGNLSPGLFPEAPPLLGGLDAVVDCIAHQVHQGIGQRLDDQLVHLHFAAVHHEVHFLARFPGDAPDGAGQLVEDLAQRDHANLEDSFLQIVELALQQSRLPMELAAPELAGGGFTGLVGLIRQPGDVGLDQEQLPDRIHQGIQPADVHPDGLRQQPVRGIRLGGALLAGGQSRFDGRSGPSHRRDRTSLGSVLLGGSNGQSCRGIV